MLSHVSWLEDRLLPAAKYVENMTQREGIAILFTLPKVPLQIINDGKLLEMGRLD